MNKLLLTVAASGWLITNSFAQGTVSFQNGIVATNQIFALSNWIGAIAVKTPNSNVFLNYGLFWGHAGAASNTLTLVSVVGNSMAGTNAALGIGNAGTLRGDSSLLIPGTASSETGVVVQIRAWAASFGNDWLAGFAACQANDPTAWWGSSRLGSLNLGPQSGPAAVLFGNSPLLAGFTVVQAVATKPSITTQPTNQMAVPKSNATFSVTATGTAPLSYQWSFKNTSLPGSTNALLALSYVQFTNAGTYQVIITNAYGAVTSQVATLTLLDTVPPAITCPVNVTVNADPGQCYASLASIVIGTPVASDDSGSVTVTNHAPAHLPVGTNVVTWTAFDPSGNSNTCTQLVIVRDVQPPSITGPTNVTVSANTGHSYASGVPLGAPVTSDNCAVAGVTSNAPAQFPVGTNVVTWTATDASGNTNTCAQLVIVRDAERPSITSCPPAWTNVARINGQAALPNFTAAVTATDNVGVTAITQVPTAGTLMNAGSAPVTIYVCDAARNTNTCTTELVALPPQVITAQPRSRTNIVTTEAVFSVAANGLSRLDYQWQVNGTPIPAATNATLHIANVQTNHAANYQVLVTMLDNSVLSDPATLTVIDQTVNGFVQMEFYAGLTGGGIGNRLVVLKGTDATNGPLATWNLPLNFTNGTASFTLAHAPLGLAHLSAKTAWHLRTRLPVSFTNGVAAVSFTSATALRVGDLDGSNTVNLGDYFILAGAWYTANPTADLDGSGWVDLDDYFLLSHHWLSEGDPE